jgi:hypothetical protein
VTAITVISIPATDARRVTRGAFISTRVTSSHSAALPKPAGLGLPKHRNMGSGTFRDRIRYPIVACSAHTNGTASSSCHIL